MQKKSRVSRPAIEQPADPSVRHIALTQGKIAIVDATDLERLSAFNWIAVTNVPRLCGAMRSDGSNVRLEREILRLRGKSGIVRFRNGDRFDFRRANLRYQKPRPKHIPGIRGEAARAQARARRPIPFQPADADVRLIALTRNKIATVDASSYEWLNSFNWQAAFRHGLFYATARISGKATHMARLLLDLKAGDRRLADHRDGDSLNCRMENLRIATISESNRNQRCRSSSGFKGVNKAFKQWRAAIHFEGSRIELGYFASPQLAAAAYDRAARKYFGEFARLNFPRREVGAIEVPSPAREILEAR